MSNIDSMEYSSVEAIVSHLVKLPEFYETQRFITVVIGSPQLVHVLSNEFSLNLVSYFCMISFNIMNLSSSRSEVWNIIWINKGRDFVILKVIAQFIFSYINSLVSFMQLKGDYDRCVRELQIIAKSFVNCSKSICDTFAATVAPSLFCNRCFYL